VKSNVSSEISAVNGYDAGMELKFKNRQPIEINQYLEQAKIK